VFLTRGEEARVGERPGLRSRVLLQAGDDAAADLAVTWVEVATGAAQTPHAHAPQQVYIVVSGSGRMLVGDEERDVGAGDLVFVPPAVRHGITNTGDDTLTYVSAATPAFSVTDLYERGDGLPQ
jgi:mannose-6-phosphate isomerase-like protein (cupin superfamily)